MLSGKPPASGFAKIHVTLLAEEGEGKEHVFKTSFRSAFKRGQIKEFIIDDSKVKENYIKRSSILSHLAEESRNFSIITWEEHPKCFVTLGK